VKSSGMRGKRGSRGSTGYGRWRSSIRKSKAIMIQKCQKLINAWENLTKGEGGRKQGDLGEKHELRGLPDLLAGKRGSTRGIQTGTWPQKRV